MLIVDRCTAISSLTSKLTRNARILPGRPYSDSYLVQLSHVVPIYTRNFQIVELAVENEM